MDKDSEKDTADQNEEKSDISKPPESPLSDASAEKATQGSDTDLDVEDPGKAFAGVMGVDLYLEACRLMEVVPVSHFAQNLAKPYINLNHHGLGPKGVKAIAITLVSNATVTHLELEDNHILAEGAICIAEMLRENCSLRELNISNNHLDTEGAEAIASLLLENASYLHTLQLSGNSFGEEAASCLADALMSNYQVKKLDLSHNEFSEKGGQLLGQMLAVNTTLEILDLSWNHLRRKGTVAFGTGLKMANNLLTVEGATELVGSVRKNPNSMMEEINISNVLVNETFIKLLELVYQTRPELDVIYGEVEGCISKISNRHPNPMKVIQKYLNEHNLRLWDFFRKIDKDGNMKIPVSDFRRAMMQQSNIQLDRVQIVELVRKLDQNQTGIVDYSFPWLLMSTEVCFTEPDTRPARSYS
ncbi:leucine-rich repeat-containing protein 74A isoform X4 [Meleagris gallopavo]|uniref:leucine-rich repeat-containing protein 74A isoform X4 n=1 Tax=Meleagris gallopavo TaxID=9103 RepID=UPI0012AB4F4B|nr:leucine-rich repeat-containing protein 74A isoform X4 [Meleagris gallopavo]